MRVDIHTPLLTEKEIGHLMYLHQCEEYDLKEKRWSDFESFVLHRKLEDMHNILVNFSNHVPRFRLIHEDAYPDIPSGE